MNNLRAVYYRAADRREPVRDFIAGLDDDVQAALDRQVERLNMLSEAMPNLPLPHSSQVSGELRELRCHYDREHYRIDVSKTANLAAMSDGVSPIGTSVSDAIDQKRARIKRYRESYDPLEPFEQIARIVIMRPGQLGLSQQELATRMGTTASVISRIESGQHRTSTDTLRKLARALDGQAMLGFEFEPGETELVAL